MTRAIRAIRSVGVFLLVYGVCCCMSAVTSALPAGRVYEMVSPIYKAGYNVGETLAVAPDGNSVAFISRGGFGGLLSNTGLGSTYLARRGVAGWSTVSLQPPFGSIADFSETLGYTLANGTLGANGGQEEYSGTEDELLLRSTGANENWEVFGATVFKLIEGTHLSVLEEGASADLCHVVVGRAGGALIAAAENTIGQIYDVARGCDGGEPSLRLIGLNNAGGVINPVCPVELGVGFEYFSSHQEGSHPEQESNFNAISADGSELFFTTNVETGSHCGEGTVQLFARLGSTRTIEVSTPPSEAETCGEDIPCPGAAARPSSYFKGASEDGSRVFFTTAAPLTGEKGNDLYMARIGCPAGLPGCGVQELGVTSIVAVSSASAPGVAAEVQGVTKVAPDGSRVYFVATGLLSKDPNAQGEMPVNGADNLYVYDSGLGRVAFIAGLCSGPAQSGTVEDARCPRDLEGGDGAKNDTGLWGFHPEAQSAGREGRFLVFSTYARDLKSDTDDAKDVYRYDAETEALERVSIGEEGYGADGNADGSVNDATISAGHMGGSSSAQAYLEQEMGVHAISKDGSRVVFTTAGPLSPNATNGLADVYEWQDGSVSLVSSGNAEEPDGSAVISPSGQDIFFTTAQGLMPGDNDGVGDIYDARWGGGFRPVPAQRQPCSGDACQGPLTNPAPLLVPGSVLQAPGENLPSPKKKKSVRKKATKKKSGKKKAKRAWSGRGVAMRGRER